MGTDLIESLHLWDNEGDRLIKGVKFLIFERPGYDQNELMKHANWPKNYKLAYDTDDVSKKILGCMMTEEIRKRMLNMIGIEGLVTPSVISFIREHQLYS